MQNRVTRRQRRRKGRKIRREIRKTRRILAIKRRRRRKQLPQKETIREGKINNKGGIQFGMRATTVHEWKVSKQKVRFGAKAHYSLLPSAPMSRMKMCVFGGKSACSDGVLRMRARPFRCFRQNPLFLAGKKITMCQKKSLNTVLQARFRHHVI